MTLDARTRSSIYQNLVPILGEHDANALMSEFPAIEADELVTKQFLRAELAELRAELRTEMGELRGEMGELRSGLRGEMGELRAELRGEMGELRGEMGELRSGLRGEMGELRGEMGELRSGLRGEIAELRIDVTQAMHRQTVMLGSGLAAATALVLTAVAAFA